MVSVPGFYKSKKALSSNFGERRNNSGGIPVVTSNKPTQAESVMAETLWTEKPGQVTKGQVREDAIISKIPNVKPDMQNSRDFIINDPTIPNYSATHYYRDQLTAILTDISKVSGKEIEVELNIIDPNQCLANPSPAINDLGVEKGSREKHEEVKLCPLPEQKKKIMWTRKVRDNPGSHIQQNSHNNERGKRVFSQVGDLSVLPSKKKQVVGRDKDLILSVVEAVEQPHQEP